MKTTTEKKLVFSCSECKGTNVQVKAWVDPNNNDEVLSDDFNLGYQDTWCRDCEDQTGVDVNYK